MKFSMIFEAQIVETDRAAEFRIFHEIVEQCLLAEKLGFDGIWAVEHTALTQYAHMSAPETFLPFIAGKTERLEIGHGVICLPPAMNHPIKVAERVATLDILSKGRVNFGMGKGGTQQEAGAFGYQLADLQPMIDESMYLIPRLFVEDEVEHDGVHIKMPRRPVHPKPYQQPHPRLYMACTRADTLVAAGARGLGALVLGFGGPDDIAKKNRIYRDAYAARRPEDQVGFRPTEHLAALCPTIVLADRQKARRIGLRGQRFFAEAIAHWYQGGPKPSTDDLSIDRQHAVMAATKEQVVAYLSEEHIPVGSEHVGVFEEVQDAYGTASHCIAYVERLFDAGADEILFLSQMGTVPQAAILETIHEIGTKVIPHFRARQAKCAAQ
jgi:alkanesulfonate monooxygenase SsuD/methylene tetrahydromethanopterin reductase-like flavin-dependent oxidoreductase (luciferase family)